MKRVVAYGDSFTAGLGTDRTVEEAIFKGVPEDKKPKARSVHREFIINNSYPKYFADKLQTTFSNRGEIGCSNLDILNRVYNDILQGDLSTNDFATVCFTSSYRDKLPFFPTFEKGKIKPQVAWSLKELILLDEDIYITDKNLAEHVFSDINPELNPSTVHRLAAHHLKFKRLFLTDLYEEYYYDFFNQNIIIQLQELFREFNIEYLFFDAFEPMVLNTGYNKLHLIDKKKYWGIGKQSIHSFLQKFNTEEVYELSGYNINNLVKKHPSRLGHEYFAEELYKYFTNTYKW